jgi:hypothetical protein
MTIPINELLNVVENIMNRNYNIAQEEKTEIRSLLFYYFFIIGGAVLSP